MNILAGVLRFLLEANVSTCQGESAPIFNDISGG